MAADGGSPADRVAPLLGRALELAANGDSVVARRLQRTVIRPLARLAGRGAPALADSPRRADGLEDRLFEFARDLIDVVVELGGSADLIEAAAGVQYLLPAERSRSLATTALELRVQTNGPYLVGGGAALQTWLGEDVAIPPMVALCRCGRSESKPFCDGTHAEFVFSGEKDAHRVPDRRDSYDGQRITVLDNRGVCAHAGFCTTRVPTAFRTTAEPFVAPSGARLDDLVKAAQQCPSGALSFAFGGQEQRHEVDTDRPPAIEVTKDGPYRVTGRIPLVDADGSPVARSQGASLEHYSLCRCGQSQNKPFCSGMHWYVDFHDPVAGPNHEPTLFEWAGGWPALLRATRIFYEKYVPEDPLIGPLFASMTPDHPERVASWLSEVFGGPPMYSERFGGYPRMIAQHLGKHLTDGQRSRWVALLKQSAAEAGLPDDAEFAAAFTSYLEWGSHIAVENSQEGARPPKGMPVPKWTWVNDATPDARVSAVAVDGAEPPPALPGAAEPVGFEEHIKGLFRQRDRQSMRFAFDLWEHGDVSANATAILERLRNGSMPCDGPWAQEKIEVFQRWVDAGMPELGGGPGAGEPI
ncbi:MAG TPA: CDGSH iron-sulfur domain-containing protein, partial [Acidimicrobiales bacterium]